MSEIGGKRTRYQFILPGKRVYALEVLAFNISSGVALILFTCQRLFKCQIRPQIFTREKKLVICFLKLGMLGEEQGTDCHRTNKIHPFHAYMDLRAHLNKTKSYHIKRHVLISGHIRSSTMTSIGQIRK